MLAKIILILSSLLATSLYANEQAFMRTFSQGNRIYEIRFLDVSRKNNAWNQDLVMRWKASSGGSWHEIDRIPQVRHERMIRLEGKRGKDVEALVVSKPGGSAEYISVVQIDNKIPNLSVILDNEIDKGNFGYRFDNQGRVTGFKFHYTAWHVEPDCTNPEGHVLTCRNIDWIPAQQCFRRGQVYIDEKAEKEASLVDLLLIPGSEQYLGVQNLKSGCREKAIITYKPVGILRDKTPMKLRSAERIKAVISLGDEPMLVDLQAMNLRK